MLHPCSGYVWGAVSVSLYVFANYRVLSLVYRLFRVVRWVRFDFLSVLKYGDSY